MGRLRLILRLAARDLRRRRAETVLLLLAFTAATTTLTLGLALQGVTSRPYERTRAATNGPDGVVRLNAARPSHMLTHDDLGILTAVAKRPGVVARSGPYPSTWGVVRAHGHATGAQVEGRDPQHAAVDQPKLTTGRWVSRDESVVMEAGLADALGVRVGDQVTVSGRPFTVSGLAVTAAIAPYPAACLATCEPEADKPERDNSGLIWATRADTRALATATNPLYYVMNLKLAHPDSADTFGDKVASEQSFRAPAVASVDTWLNVRHRDARTTDTVRMDLLVAGWLLGMLAIASVAVLVGGRMADQTRRVGLLKAVGGTPALVAAVLLAEYLVIAVAAAAAGIGTGALVAPILTSTGGALLGSSGLPPVTAPEAAIVVAVALLVAISATFVPAVRAGRTSTVRALADTTRAPKRRPRLVALSARLPVPLLLGLRLAARRPRRSALGAASVAVTVSGVVAVLIAHQRVNSEHFAGPDALVNPLADRLNETMLLVTVMIGVLASINAIFIVWATVLDARHSSAVVRALGASPGQVTSGLVAAQALPVLFGAVWGLPGGLLLYTGVRHGGTVTLPSPLWLATVLLGTVLIIPALTILPARTGAHRSLANSLQAETT
ncbi:FtsX-like permease family protein [Streptomyces sp. NPDC004393]